jgi:hypothetical protein
VIAVTARLDLAKYLTKELFKRRSSEI